MPVKKGDKIKVDYEGRLENGQLFDSSKKHGHPLEFEVGSGQLIKGFDEGVIGMEVGEEKEVKIPSAEAYGDVKEELKKDFPKDKFPKDQQVEAGMMVMMHTPMGEVPAKILEVKEETVTIDLNHPLAGKTLIFKIKVVEILS